MAATASPLSRVDEARFDDGGQRERKLEFRHAVKGIKRCSSTRLYHKIEVKTHEVETHEVKTHEVKTHEVKTH
ncbi:hypothetical protein OUZ56_033228, partial [Daphnia magna]